MAEFALVLVWMLAGVVLIGGVVAALMAGIPPAIEGSEAVRRSRWLVLARAAVSVLSAFAVFAVGIVLHNRFSEWQAVTVVSGPVAGAAVGLMIFALWPSPAIDGPVPRRVASLERRRLIEQAPRWLWHSFVTVIVGSVVVIFTLAALSKAGPDGRSLCFAYFRTCPPSYGAYLYPGWFFGVPALICIALIVVAVVGCLARIASTATPAWQELSPVDSRLRSNSARLVVSVGITACLLTKGMLLFTAGALFSQASTLASELSAQQTERLYIAGIVTVVLSLVILLAGLVSGVAGVLTAVRVARIDRIERVQAKVSSA